MDLSRRTIAFVNLAHALDHFLLLIYPTAVLVIALERGLSYAELIGLATGAFVAFGFFSLPVGWVADRVGRRNLLAAFFLGGGAACLLVAASSTPLAWALSLFVLGVFTAIYHPVGSAMIVSHSKRLGHDLGVNAVWGNCGAAFAAGVTGVLAAWLGWRWAFIVPGVVCLAAGTAFLVLVRGDGDTLAKARKATTAQVSFASPVILAALFCVTFVAGGITFNIATIALPKAIDERLGLALPIALVGGLATAVFLLGALTQLAVGRLIDRVPIARLFAMVAFFQPFGLALAALTTGVPMLAGLALAMAAIYGQVVINDAMVARYVPGRYQAKAFGIRYFLGFTTSGFAVPAIAWLHTIDGFLAVFLAAASAGLMVFAAALLFVALPAAAPAALRAPSA
jgi:MFS family permease